MHYLYGFIILLGLSGCNDPQPTVVNNQYTLEECKEELLNAEDYSQGERIDKIVVIKKERKMYLYRDDEVVNTIPVSLGKNPIGHKQEQGDNRTPEGEFFIHRKLCSPQYYRSLCISYPRPEDKANAAKKGVNPGGAVTLHGQPTWNADGKGDNYTLTKNWTQGCVAVTNAAMRELWYSVREGVPIIIQ